MSYARVAAAPDIAEQKPPAGSVPSHDARLVTAPGMAVTTGALTNIVASRPGLHDLGVGWHPRPAQSVQVSPVAWVVGVSGRRPVEVASTYHIRGTSDSSRWLVRLTQVPGHSGLLSAWPCENRTWGVSRLCS